MFAVRSLRWPDDRNAICALDTSFTTERVFRVVASASAFQLIRARYRLHSTSAMI